MWNYVWINVPLDVYFLNASAWDHVDSRLIFERFSVFVMSMYERMWLELNSNHWRWHYSRDWLELIDVVDVVRNWNNNVQFCRLFDFFDWIHRTTRNRSNLTHVVPTWRDKTVRHNKNKYVCREIRLQRRMFERTIVDRFVWNPFEIVWKSPNREEN